MSKDWQELLIEGTITAQGMAIAAREIARELLFRWVSTQPDPAGTLREMFDSIMQRMEPTGGSEKGAHGEAREYVELIFADLDRRLRK